MTVILLDRALAVQGFSLLIFNVKTWCYLFCYADSRIEPFKVLSTLRCSFIKSSEPLYV